REQGVTWTWLFLPRNDPGVRCVTLAPPRIGEPTRIASFMYAHVRRAGAATHASLTREPGLERATPCGAATQVRRWIGCCTRPHWIRHATMARLNIRKIIDCASAVEWEAWLERNHASDPEAWLRLAKKGSGAKTVSRAEA